MKNNDNVTFSNNMETVKKKYTLSGAAIAEMVCSVVLLIALSQPWVKNEVSGESISLIEAGGIAFFYAGVFMFNIILKYFKRSRWMSWVTATVAILMHTELGANHINSNYHTTQCTPAIGEQIVFIVGVILLAIVFLSWIASIGVSVVRAYRDKQYFSVYSSCLGLFSLCFIALLLFGVALTGSTDEFFEVTHNPFLKVVIVFFMVGLVVFFCWAIIGGIIWIIRKIRGTTNSSDSQTIYKIDTQKEAIPSIRQKDNSIIQQEETTLNPESIHGNDQESETSKKNNSTLIYAISGIIAVALIGIISFFAFGKSKQSDNVLGLQKPTWKKFVVVNGDDAYLYRQPDTNSDELKNSGCDGDCDHIYVWTEADLQEGYHIQNNVVSNGVVYPVVEETSGWYKVHISQYNVREAWIKKSACTEVKPEPITTETIKKMSYGWENYRFVEEGKYKDMFFRTYEMFAGHDVQMGVLDNGVLLASTAATDVTVCYELEDSLRWVDTSDTSNGDFAIYKLAITDKQCKDEFLDDPHLDPSKLSDADIETLVTTFKPGKKEGVNAYYYFPTVKGKDIIRFTIYPDESTSTDNNETTTSNDKENVSDYKVEGNVLYAKMGEEWIATGITSEDFEIMIDKKYDLDNDGNMEAIVYEAEEHGLCWPFIVYYDKERSSFKKTENLEFNSMPTTQTSTDGNVQLLQREGIRWIVYSFREGNLKRIEDRTKDVGRVRTTLRMDDLFANDGTGNKTISIDIDGDGEEESVTIHRDETHAGGYGSYMSIYVIRWQDGREIGNENYSVVSGATIKILEVSHNGMPDIIADNYLQRWNGSDYESWVWDGEKLKKE